MSEEVREIEIKKSSNRDCPEDFKIRTYEGEYEDLYIVQDTLGEGSYGKVCQVVSKKDGKIYADKVIESEEDDLMQIEKEIWFLEKSDHVNIIKGIDSFFHNDSLHIIMECCETSIVDMTYVLQRTLNEEELVLVVYYTLCGLKYLHEQNVVHRDIKGGNILVSHDGGIKLTDFGVSAQLSFVFSFSNWTYHYFNFYKRYGEKEGHYNWLVIIFFNSNSLFRTGTAFWMAPEIILEKKYDEKCDIWSLGITILELCEGKPPLHGTNPFRAFFLIPLRDPPKLKDESKWSSELKDFLYLCLQKQPSKRPSAEELIFHPWIIKNVTCKYPPGGTKTNEMNLPLIKAIESMHEEFDSKGGRKEYWDFKREEERKEIKRRMKKRTSSTSSTSDGSFSDHSDSDSDCSSYGDDSSDDDSDDITLRPKNQNDEQQQKKKKKKSKEVEEIKIFDSDDDEEDYFDSDTSEYTDSEEEDISASDLTMRPLRIEQIKEEGKVESKQQQQQQQQQQQEEEEEEESEKELKKRLFSVFFHLNQQNVISFGDEKKNKEVVISKRLKRLTLMKKEKKKNRKKEEKKIQKNRKRKLSNVELKRNRRALKINKPLNFKM